MKLEKVETYSAGYSKEELLRKCAAGALGVAMLGGLAGCMKEIVEPDLEGATTYVSQSDDSDESLPYEGKVVTESFEEEKPKSAAQGDDEEEKTLFLAGDTFYIPVNGNE